jgi:hypothetical protein
MRKGVLLGIVLVALLGVAGVIVSGDDAPVSSDGGDTGAAGPAGDGGSPLPVAPQPGMAGVRAIPWDRHEVVDDRTVRIFFTSGVEPCYVLDRVDVAYQPTEVRITLFEGSDPRAAGQACIELAVGKVVAVALDQPLAGRAVIDGA